jgi:mRNA interferase MazF
VRPVIVVQRGTIDRFTQTVVIVPLTSTVRRLNIPGTFTIPADEGGLTQESVALCYQIAVIDRQRLIRQLGKLSLVYIQQLNEALIYTLQLDQSISEIDES